MREDKTLLCRREHCKGKESESKKAGQEKNCDVEAGISFLRGEQIKRL